MMYKNKAWMYNRFVVQKKSVDEIAAEAKCSRRTVYNYLLKFGFIKAIK